MPPKHAVKQTKPVVISASRRTDLAGCFPDAFIKRLDEYPPERVHTLVIWTKNPLPLIHNNFLRKKIEQYRQIFIHVTVTGMGGSKFEPHIPSSETILDELPRLIQLIGNPDRLTWRFDPIVHLKQGDQKYSNISFFPELSAAFARHGISSVKISWLSLYKKVIRNLKKIGWEPEDISLEKKKEEARNLEKITEARNQKIDYCCVEGFPVSRCIDGMRLGELHPDHIQCSVKRARGQRALCGCTESIDIGWYNQTCLHGCVYCYANPKIEF